MLVGTLNSAYLRTTYLRGIDLGAAWHGPSADAAITSILQGFIESAQGKIGIQFKRQRVLTYPDPGLVLGTDYEIQGEPLPYYHTAPDASFFTIPLPFANVQSIERVRLFYGNPGTQAASLALYQIPPPWITFTGTEGILRISPGTINTVWQGQLGGFNSLYYGFWRRDGIPGAWAIDYTIGNGLIREDIVRWICLTAAIQVLTLAGTALSHGLSTESLTMDGITESNGFAQGKYGPYGGTIQAFQDELKCIDVRQLRLRHKGIKVGIF